MKNLKTLLALPCILAIHSAFAQSGAHLKLSDQFPAAGENIALSYDPQGTVVEGKNDIVAVAYYYNDKDFSVADVDLKPDGKLLKANITLPAGTEAFFVKISSGDKVDDNDKNGYIYLVYKDKKPVEGAYAHQAIIPGSMEGYYAKIKFDSEASLAFYKKEFARYPQSETAYQANYYFLLARSPASRDVVNQKIAGLEKSADEKDLLLAANLLTVLRRTKDADSLSAVAKAKFPGGLAAKDGFAQAFRKTKDLSKKDSVYNAFISKYPETPTDNYLQNSMRVQLAMGYLAKPDMDNYRKYAGLIKDKAQLMANLNNLTWDWAVKGERLSDAEELSKQTVDFATAQLNNPTPSTTSSPRQVKAENQQNYNMFADTYGYILLKEHKAAEALKYAKEVYDNVEETNSSEHYILALAENGMYDKALEIATAAIKKGQTSDVLTTELKKDYIKVKGSDAGYDDYFASLASVSKIAARAELAKTMVDQNAPAFTLKDLDGNKVSLADLKGKVVIVDFWATWCGPCKASFPGMQLAVSKYKDDPNVKFLFVDTWETAENYADGVKKFIADNKYTFHVLLDEKGPDGRQAKVVNDYGVGAIPTKFIIDKNGHIRFVKVGNAETAEKILDEVSAMIDLAGNPDAVAVDETTTGVTKASSNK